MMSITVARMQTSLSLTAVKSPLLFVMPERASDFVAGEITEGLKARQVHAVSKKRVHVQWRIFTYWLTEAFISAVADIYTLVDTSFYKCSGGYLHTG
jgi:hypothetical protein